MRLWLMLFALGAGALLPIQAAMTGAINRAVQRPALVVMISLTGSFVVTLVAGLVTGRLGLVSAERAATVPWWAWPAGVCGAIFLLSQPVVAPRVGAGLFTSLAIAGSLTGAVLLDHFGALHLPSHPISWPRMLGVALMAAGAALVARN